MTDAGWRRLHTPPKKCRDKWNDDICGYEPMTARQEYYLKRSYERYLRTPDGIYFSNIKWDGTLGRSESIRFVETLA